MGSFKTVEERRAYYRTLHKKHLDEMTPEQLTEYRQKTRDNWNKWREKQPKEKLDIIHEKVKAGQRRRWHSLSPDKKTQELERLKNIYYNMAPEEKAQKKLNEKQWRWNLKISALKHYSKGELRCMNPNCEVPGGAKNPLSLQVDHINGGGRKQAIQLRKQGTHFYLWLYHHNYPLGYQTYCANCNTIKKCEHHEDCVPKKKCIKKKRRNGFQKSLEVTVNKNEQ